MSAGKANSVCNECKQTTLLAGYYCKYCRESKFQRDLEYEEALFYKAILKVDDFTELTDISEIKDFGECDTITKETAHLVNLVDSYRPTNGHFDKEYRTLTGSGERLLLLIDKLDESKINHSFSRSSMVAKVQDILSNLNQKMHSDGKLCKICPLKDSL